MDAEHDRVAEGPRAGSGGPAARGTPWRRLRSWLAARSIAGRVFLWLLLAMVLLVSAVATALTLQIQHHVLADAREHTTSAAAALAHSPGMAAALDSPDPTAQLQPVAEQIRTSGGLFYVAFYSPTGVGYVPGPPGTIDQHLRGTLQQAAAGPRTTTFGTPRGTVVNTTAPVTRADGSLAGYTSVGITPEQASQVANQQLPVLFTGAAAALVLGVLGIALVRRRLRRQTHGLGPEEMTRMYEHHDAVLHAVREGVLIVGGDARVLLANDEARRLLELPPEVEGRPVSALGLAPELAEQLAAGREATDEVHLVGDRLLAVNIRPTAPFGGQPGSVVTVRDTTELSALTGRAEQAKARLQLLYDAGLRVGTTLDITRTAQELADIAVPRFADFATVELADPVLRGDEPSPDTGRADGPQVRRTALRGTSADAPLYPVGTQISFLPTVLPGSDPDAVSAVLTADLREARRWRSRYGADAELLLGYGIRSLISAPLQARGVVLGVVSFWRTAGTEPFDEDDLSFATELAARAAISIDNARRYTREHRTAETLQRSLLPHDLPAQSPLDLAYRYLPATQGVGGDWFDVIPLSGLRVALVVGDVVGHGLHAAATMGRLRTAVLNFSALDLPPDELIARLDELVIRLDQGGGTGITGATCVYAVYDPVSGDCDIALAGHPPPVLLGPDGGAQFVELPAGLPLGVGGLPFESTRLSLPVGTRLVLYTDGLVAGRHRGIGDGLTALRDGLAAAPVHGSPEDICEAVLGATVRAAPPAQQSDDATLLVARTHRLAPSQVAVWEVPSDPAAVSRVRSECVDRLTEWGLEPLAFTTELLLSELITNAIRYGTQPITVRLLRDHTLVCEVADGSSTAPHLRYAATTDEGGRGLFLVAQLTQRWGTRYTDRGKIIWAEQSLTAAPDPFRDALNL
ncbi:SpoIIE family protein phosphatase [Kitasatospora viridis]|uniref:protein-serine/threonine phosphatase n=1 Tax=Kitasatospora viridis TaxID=281105 RepID=A0A561UM77_9ACTN|nr:SpoIIE family protein phosphatase [Kitasatospora viridis]TWG00483.1 GAF domain-containing protein [Kitasatospora viridis]